MIKTIIQNEKQKYKFCFIFVKKYFVDGGIFDFNNYSQKTFFYLMSKLSDLTNNNGFIIKTEFIKNFNDNNKIYNKKIQNKEFFLKDLNYHQVDLKKIKDKCSVLYKKLNETIPFPLFQIAITPIERLLFYQIPDKNNGKIICYPVGYDKYHFLNSKNTTHHHGINTNKYKYSIYDKLRTLTNYQHAEELIDELFKEEHKITQYTKKEIIENLKKQCLNLNKKNNKNYKKIVKNFLKTLEKNF